MRIKNQSKSSGILCHVTSLPTAYGVGDFGPIAYEFVDKLALAHQQHWQILPIGNTDNTGCPYATDSAFGCANYYISPDLLIEKYRLDKNIFNKYFLDLERVDFKQVKENKQKILEFIFKQFYPDEKFNQFLKQENEWIVDYCYFRALAESRGDDWRKWDNSPLSELEKNRMNFHQFCQYELFSQLENLKKYANAKNIKLVGDLPIFVAYMSMDVWKHPHQFLLNDSLEMEYETGAAPDAFSKNGQKWGTPLYNWSLQKDEGYKWWDQRLRFLKRYFDVVRIDHFRGFCATWISKVSDLDASDGHWQSGPGTDLFQQLYSHFDEYPEMLAEDLGVITSDVDDLREAFHFPGMKVFQFMLGDASNPHKLYNYQFNSVAYSGTHDCDTLMGWLHCLSPSERSLLAEELKIDQTSNSTFDQWVMIRILLESNARLVFIQIQDLLGLGSEARFNYPGTVQPANWTWKMDAKNFKSIDWRQLAELTKKERWR